MDTNSKQQTDQSQQKVVVIRLPANYPTHNNSNAVANTVTTPDGNNIPNINQFQITDEIVAQLISHQVPLPPADSDSINIEPNSANDVNSLNMDMMQHDNTDHTQMTAMYNNDHPNINNGHQQSAVITSPTDTNTANNNGTNTANTNTNTIITTTGAPSSVIDNGTHIIPELVKTNDKSMDTSGASAKEGHDTVQYKNYTPKQREWMLVVLSYSRGILGKPFEIKLNDSVIEQARAQLQKHAADCNMDRIPTPKTLRALWKNLWTHPERTVSSVKRGGRPRIDPDLKRQKRNERERRRRIAARQEKGQGELGEDRGHGHQGDMMYQEPNCSYAPNMQPAAPRRSRRGPKPKN